MKTDISAYILAGGKSLRMGKDKAMLTLGNKNFASHISDTINSINIPCKIVSSNEEHKQLPIPIIKDTIKNIGPIGGLKSALSDTSTIWNLIISCDLPLISKQSIEWLLNVHQKGFDATITIVNGKTNPIFGIYRKDCDTPVQTQITKANYKMIHLLDKLHVNYVKAPDNIAKELLNVNTPYDLKMIEKWR